MNAADTVGIALSGGGHRATAFGLGTLLYLVDAGLHRRVAAISSVSGGSILNAYLAAAQAPFNKLDSAQFDELAGRIAKGIAAYHFQA